MSETRKETDPPYTLMVDHTQNNDEKLSYLILMKNQFFLARVLVILITIGILILSICYCIGQVLQQILTDYWCDKKTPLQIAKHSQDNGLNKGDPSGCWKSKLFTVNYDKLWSTSSYSHESVTDAISWFKFSMFLTLSLILFLLIIYNIILLMYDAKTFHIRTLGVSEAQKKLQSDANMLSSADQSDDSHEKSFFHCIKRYLRKIFETDSGWWCIVLFARELFEVLIQSITLLFYNGYFSSSADDVPMAYSRKYIIFFTCIIAGNCVTACILWLFYTFKPYICHGSAFEILVYSFDVLFDVLYTLFPLIIIFETNQNILTSLAALQTNTAITFFSTYIPLFLLTWSSYSFSLYSRQAMNSYYGNIFLSNQMGTEIEMTAADLSENDVSLFHTPHKVAWVALNKKKTASVCIVALCFGVYGIILLSVVISHFNGAISYCSSVVDEVYNLHTNHQDMILSHSSSNILQQHPELLFWNSCYYKVYPFGRDRHGDYQCQCRSFYAAFYDERFVDGSTYSHVALTNDSLIDWSVEQLDTYFALDYVEILSNILEEWYMLEKFKWSGTKTKYREYSDHEGRNETEPPLFNFTADKFVAKQMKVFELSETPIEYLDESISNWKHLAYFTMNNAELAQLPQAFRTLQQLVYFEMSLNVYIEEFPTQLCHLIHLRALIMKLTAIHYIPTCVEQLQHLESMSFTAATRLKAFPIGIFNIKSLKELSLIQASITIQSLMKYNNFTNFTELDAAFRIDHESLNNVWFQGSQLCNQYMHDLIPAQMINVVTFINDLESCTDVCDSKVTANDLLAYVDCPPYKHHNGVCDELCNYAGCFFDGGDCSQLCECDFQQLSDDKCNVTCNTTNCLYDGKVCLEKDYNINSTAQCEATYEQHHCAPTWIGDGYCDWNCENSLECNNDLNDCDGCENFCNTVDTVFGFVGNSVSNDDLASEEELCNFWESLKQAGLFEGVNNCTDGMRVSDINQDAQLTLYEVLLVTNHAFNISKEKAQQLDCSRCVGDGKYWVDS